MSTVYLQHVILTAQKNEHFRDVSGKVATVTFQELVIQVDHIYVCIHLQCEAPVR
jgi:hypothetical protein